ncbi:MAG TPA: YncE family protein [Candidatus Angelobacter sp.]|nr:YncE family protein [Candidatus Angelobacter sp.]
MYWTKAGLFAAVIVGLAVFLAMTDTDEGTPETPVASTNENGAHTLKQVAAFDLPGPAGKRFDYLTIDYDDGYLLSAHLGPGLLYVIDLKDNKVIATIPDVPGVEGVEYVPDLRKAYTSDWREQKIGVIDLRQKKVIAKLSALDKPDGSAYAAPFHKLYVSDERAKAEIVIDVQTDKVVKTLYFKSETGMPQYDPVARLVYVNLQDLDVMTVIDPATDRVVTPVYTVSPCKGNHGMALDPEHRRAFLVCEGNERMAVLDLDQHKVITTLPVAPDPDVIKYDPGLKRIYVACYSGAISVFQEDDPDHFRKLEDFPVQHKVHSLAVDEHTHRVYVPEEEESGKQVARMIVYEPVERH